MIEQAKYTFLLFRQEMAGCDQIEAEIRANPKCQVEVVDTLQELFDRLAKGKVNSLIFNLRLFDNSAVTVIQKIKTLVPDLATTIVSPGKISNIDYEKLKKYKEIVLIEKPVKPGDFTLLTTRLIDGKPIYFREHKRFLTYQPISLEKLTSGEKCDGWVYNMSRAGAYIELVKGSLNPGDLFHVSIRLDTISKAHGFHAEVVWTKQKGQHQPGQAAGLKFVSEEQVYKILMARV